ncbi:MAG: cytidine deaminase [Rikenellaceae bacterium]|jgi:cytidine deaminase|nr:cytidine deaminase [Rikenellaceae bacterium]
MDKKFSFDYRTYDSLAGMPAGDRELVAAAKKACGTAYAPYSKFHVGAAARLQSGRIVTGSNQESEVFPAGVCAERSLLFHHQAHEPEDKIVALAIASDPDQRECYPCGICRQVIADTEKRQGSPIRVIMTGHDSASVVDSARSLLPFTFEL